MLAFFSGFGLSLSLILAIGAQNAFVLRHGIRREHVAAIVATCILSEAILIGVGVAGFGALSHSFPMLDSIARWGGALFLAAYGALSLKRALTTSEALISRNGTGQSLRNAILTCLAITWLNPHVYLDTVVLIGAVAHTYESQRWLFGAGALTASTVFFVALGYGAVLLQPVFANPLAWRVLDSLIALLMWTIAATLILA